MSSKPLRNNYKLTGFTTSDYVMGKILREGPKGLSDSELLALAISGGDGSLELACKILNRFGSLRKTAEAALQELLSIKGVGPARAARIKAVVEIGRRVLSHPLAKTKRIVSSRDVYDLYRHYMPYFRDLKQEVFKVLMLDAKNRIFAEQVVSIGSLTSSIVHPREVFAEAIRNSAASVILIHNHPSGDPTPSPEDVDITGRLAKAGDIVGIKVLDHVIIGDGEYMSFADRKLL